MGFFSDILHPEDPRIGTRISHKGENGVIIGVIDAVDDDNAAGQNLAVKFDGDSEYGFSVIPEEQAKEVKPWWRIW